MKSAVFGGKFIITFAKTVSEQVLNMQLTTAGGGMKRERDVNLPSIQMSTANTPYKRDRGSPDFTRQEPVKEDARQYDIVRNRLYRSLKAYDRLATVLIPNPRRAKTANPYR